MKKTDSLHQVKFQYKDGKVLNVKVPSSLVNSFLESLHKSTLFWTQEETEDQHQDNGFWTNIEDIRFIRTELIHELPDDKMVS